MLTIDEQERGDERLWGMFYRGPTVGAKCTYQNPELGHFGVDVVELGSWTSYVDFESDLC